MSDFICTFFSKSLSRPVHFNAVLSNDNAYGTEDNPYYQRQAKNIYLLHGYSGGEMDWFVNAPLQDLANRYNVNFFMPCGDNSFYLDQPQTGFKYCTYVGQEFVDYTRRTFGLSTKREDTYIGGLSMGGYGAIHTGLTYPETFAGIMAFSSALIVNQLDTMSPEDNNPMANYGYYELIFGDLSKAAKTDINPSVLVEKLKKSGSTIPKIYMACGTEDFLVHANNDFKKELDRIGVEAEYQTWSGIHDFVFWRKALEEGMKWAFENEKDA